jgi:hypothetical protein
MRIIRTGLLAAIAVLSTHAGTIVDVSRQTAQVLNSGDSLFFLVSNLTLPGNIDKVAFQFITQSLNPMSQFEAELTARSGTVAIAFPTVQISRSTVLGAGYTGPVWSLSGILQLPDTLSNQIFENTHATLVLHNVGRSTNLGLSGYTLPQDLAVSLTSGAANAGAVVNGALYEDPPPFSDAPESNSVALLAGGGALLCLFSKALKRIHTAASDSGIREKSSVCNPVRSSDTI